MLQELSTRLSRVIEQKRRKKKLTQDLQAVEAELREKSARLAALEAQLQKEKVDVQKLEQMSLTALFYGVLGSREQQLEKERQELLSAQLEYGRTKKQVEFLEQEQSGLAAQLDALAGIETEYELTLAEKEGWLRQSHPAVANQLLALSEQIANLKAQRREMAEAIGAGQGVVSALEQVVASLESAGNWGVWDMFGGGLISTAIKHSRIDEARARVDDVQARMSRFNRELADVRRQVDLQIDIDPLTSFGDYFFDGLITDWIVQSRINDSLVRSQGAKETVARAVRHLQGMQTAAQARLDELQETRAHLVQQT